MRKVIWFCAVIAMLACSALSAEEATKSVSTATAKETASAPETKEVTTAKAETATAKETVKGETKEELKPAPLHEHPTLLRMLQRNNELRRRVGLRPHRINAALTKAAQDHAVYMARTGNFSHYSNGGPQGRAARWGFGGGIRENIAMGQSDVNSAFSSWQNSSGHWASIVSGTSEAGFGYAVDSSGRGYWVAVYGN